jgi:hypothetical protein
MWSDTVHLKFTSQSEWEALGLQNGHTFDATVLGTFTREDGTQSTGWHVDCRYVGELPDGLEAFVITPASARHSYA